MNVDLSDSQRAIVEAGDTPLLVVAGPGAGKTAVLRARIERLLESTSPFARILAITFTNVAAANLRSRLAGLHTDKIERVDISTFHGFAMRILQQYGSHIGLASSFSIITEQADREALLSLALEKLGADTGIASSFSSLLTRLYERAPDSASLDQYVDELAKGSLLPRLFDKYVDISLEHGQLDFSLLVFLANRLMTTYPAIAKQVRKVYRYICVDEFQDTNDSQFRLLQILASQSPSGLLFLADQDQVIYQWNGASPRRLLEAKEYFKMEVLAMPTSFRCPPNIMIAANRLISKNPGRFLTPTYHSARTTQGSIVVVRHSDEQAEAVWLAQKLLETSGDQPSNIAVLARTRKLIDFAFKAALQTGVRAVIPTPRYEFVSAPLVMLHSLLRLASKSDNIRRMEQLCAAFNLLTGSDLDADTLVAEATARDITGLEVFANVSARVCTSESFAALLSFTQEELIAHKEFRGFSEIFFRWIESDEALVAVSSIADYSGEREVWQQLERQNTGLQSERVSLDEFLRRIDLESKAPPLPSGVHFMTVHSAKGLEYDRVFIIGASDDQFPSFQAVRSGTDSEVMQEERRSFFVAITRCKETLTLSYASRYNGYPKRISRFITEMGLSEETPQ